MCIDFIQRSVQKVSKKVIANIFTRDIYEKFKFTKIYTVKVTCDLSFRNFVETSMCSCIIKNKKSEAKHDFFLQNTPVLHSRNESEQNVY